MCGVWLQRWGTFKRMNADFLNKRSTNPNQRSHAAHSWLLMEIWNYWYWYNWYLWTVKTSSSSPCFLLSLAWWHLIKATHKAHLFNIINKRDWLCVLVCLILHFQPAVTAPTAETSSPVLELDGNSCPCPKGLIAAVDPWTLLHLLMHQA